jgi:hypothetical protein
MPFSSPVRRLRTGMTLGGLGATSIAALSAADKALIQAANLKALLPQLVSEGWGTMQANAFIDSMDPSLAGATAFNAIANALGQPAWAVSSPQAQAWMAALLMPANATTPVIYTGPPNNVPAGSNAGLVTAVLQSNLTAPGQPFQVGDTYLITVQGAPNQPVTMLGLLNGVITHPAAQMGTTDATGAWTLQGVFVAANIGAHMQTWTVGSVASIPITFTVSAASAVPGTPLPAAPPPATTPAVTYTPTLSLTNTSRPGQPFQVGDGFRVSITGAAPNAPVTASSVQNGATQGAVAMGSTDASGSYSTSGSMSTSSVGTWLETWTVAGVALSPIAFSVAAASGTGSGYTAPASGSATPGATPSTTPTATAAGTDWFSQTTLGLPNWMFAAGGGLLLVLAFSGGRR